MKRTKIIPVLIAIAVLVGAGAAYARPGLTVSPAGKNQNQGLNQKSPSGKSWWKAFSQGAGKRISNIKSNEGETSRLKAQIKQKSMNLKKEIQRLRQNRTPLTGEQVECIRQATALIRQNSASLSSEKLSVGQVMARLRAHKNMQNGAGCIQEMDRIIAIQQQRIGLLRETLQQIEQLEKSLSSAP